MAWIEKRGSKYVVAYRNEAGKIKRIPGYTDRTATKQLMARYEKAKAHGAEGLTDPYAEHKARPLAEHVADYLAGLRSLGRDEKYIYNVGKRLDKLIELCGWSLLADITADSFCRWRENPIEQKQADSKDKRIGPRTLNQYREAIRSFCRWCVKRNRLPSNPVGEVQKADETADVRRSRRALSEAEIGCLLKAVAPSHKPVYRFILATGLRRQEVMDLQWGDVRLDAPLPFLSLRAAATKSRRADVLPLRTDIADELRKLRGDAGDGDRVFVSLPTIEEHREYLTAAGIDWKDADGRRADIHALRHTFGTMLSTSGVTPREAMALMRHSDIKLTMKTYTDPRLFNLAGAVARLPLPAQESVAKPRSGTGG